MASKKANKLAKLTAAETVDSSLPMPSQRTLVL